MGLGVEALVEQERVVLLEALLLAAGEVREQPRLGYIGFYRLRDCGHQAYRHGWDTWVSIAQHTS